VIGQRLAFGLPLVLTTPIALSLVIGFLSTVTMSVNGCDFKFPMWDRDVTTINPIEIFTKYSEICKLGIQNIIVDRRAIFLSCAYK
jgi:hypothetical protein